jgi:hypothetical protein
MFSPYYGCDEYEGDYLAREMQEEFFAQADYLSEAYGATARDAADFADEDYDAMVEEACELAASLGVLDGHVQAKRIHDSAVRIAAGNAAFDDIPF